MLSKSNSFDSINARIMHISRPTLNMYAFGFVVE